MKLDSLKDIKAEMESVYRSVREGELTSDTGLEMARILRLLQDITDLTDRNAIFEMLREGERKHAEYLANRPKPDTSRIAKH